MKKISQEIPLIPEKIVEAINNNSFALFLGAGVSRLVNCWGWNQLASEYVNLCIKKGFIDHKDRDTLMSYSDNRKIITITHEILKENNHLEEFYSLMRLALKTGEETNEQLYNDIMALRPLVVTTNADNFLNQYYSPNRIVSSKFIKEGTLDKTSLFKIHGTIDKTDTLIFTLPSYFARYRDSDFQNFLHKLFSEFTILFVGYGLAEFELLEFLFSKGESSVKNEMNHFILLDFYEGEDAKLSLEKRYYKHLGIEIIDYCKNKNGYDEVKNIFHEWKKSVTMTTSVVTTSISDIDKYLKHPNEENIDKAIALIKYDQQARDYFWQNVVSSDPKGKCLKALNKDEHFSIRNMPLSEEMPLGSGKFYIKHWPALEYLKKVVFSKQQLTLVIKIVNKIIKDSSKFELSKRNRIVDWKITEIILLLPLERISDIHINFIKNISLITDNFMASYLLEDFFIKRLFHSSKLELLFKFLNLLFESKPEKDIMLETKTLVQSDIIQTIAESLPKQINKKFIKQLIDFTLLKVKSTYKASPFGYSTTHINTIEESQQNFISKKLEYSLIRILRELLLKLSDADLKKPIKVISPSKEPVLKRLVFFIINQRYKNLNKFFWSWKQSPLKEEGCKHEIYELLKANCIYFSENEARKILTWIKEIKPSSRKDISKAENRKYKSVRQKEWLSALENDGFILIDEVKSFFVELNKITPGQWNHPGYYSWSAISSGVEISKGKEEVWVGDNKSIVDFVLSPQNWDGYNESGISEHLKGTIKNNPKQRSNDIIEFLALPLIFKQDIIYAFYQAASDTTDINIEEVVKFIEETIKAESFWIEYKRESNWLIDSITWFLKEVLKNDSFIISLELLKRMETIVLDCLQNFTEKREYSSSDNFMTDAINSTKGKLYQAFLEVNLRNGRMQVSTALNKWLPNSFDALDKILKQENRDAEFQYLIGAHLPNFLFLNNEWTKNEFDLLFPLSNVKSWSFAFTSYLYVTGMVYYDIYDLFKYRKHLDFALTYYLENNHTTDKLIQQVCVMYNQEVEKLEDANSLISKILSNKNHNQISFLISFYLYLPNRTDKVIHLWEKLFAILNEIDDNVKLHAGLMCWIEAVPDIDEKIVEWVKFSIDNLKEPADYHFFDCLIKRFEEAPELIGAIYEYLISKSKETYSPKDKILLLVEGLYLKQFKELADRICLSSMAKSDFYLKELYYKYNPD